MKVFFQDIQASTRNRTELVDITRSVEEIVRKSEIKNGLCIIHSVQRAAIDRSSFSALEARALRKLKSALALFPEHKQIFV